ncbi:MAG: hypothetical protein IT223_04055 [Crocinitomicaceae bacterium]|nr:hypothetical protein [Crocinitomicaceae bacterium]
MSLRPIYFPPLLLLFAVSLLGSVIAQAAELNQTDPSGRRQGYWIIYGETSGDRNYSPKAKVEEGNFRDDIKEGLWKKYWPSGKLRSEMTYENGRPSGAYRLFYENGQQEEQGIWVNNKNTGEFKRYYTNGNMQQWFLFLENGKRNGLQKYFHENGKISMEVFVENGIENGVAKRYDLNGALVEEKTFVKGVVGSGGIKKIKTGGKHSLPKSDPYDSRIGKESETIADMTNRAEVFRATGFNILYNSNGQITQSGEFKNGKLCNGKWYRYNESGLLVRTEIYKDFKYIGTAPDEKKD